MYIFILFFLMQVDGLLCLKKNSAYSEDAGGNAIWLKVDMVESLLGYALPANVDFKPTTEKVKKQREYFISLAAKKEQATENGQDEDDKDKSGDGSDEGETDK